MKTVYKADDGTIFDTEKECEEYELRTYYGNGRYEIAKILHKASMQNNFDYELETFLQILMSLDKDDADDISSRIIIRSNL